MWFLKKLLGSALSDTSVNSSSLTYKGYRIFPAPQRVGAQFRISACIERDVDGEKLSHTLIRVDTFGEKEEAKAVSVAKAKQVIDEQGDAIFK